MIQSRSTCFQWGFYDPQMSGSIDGTDLIPHDRALIRAYKTKYENPKMNSSLFIGHIPPDCDENHLKFIFPQTKDIHLIRDRVTKESKGYAFANGFIDRTKEYRWNQHLLFIENVASNTLIGWKPRRCGGGLGGNKKSGQLRFGGILRPFQKNSFRQFNENVQQRWKYLIDKSKQKRISFDEKIIELDK